MHAGPRIAPADPILERPGIDRRSGGLSHEPNELDVARWDSHDP